MILRSASTATGPTGLHPQVARSNFFSHQTGRLPVVRYFLEQFARYRLDQVPPYLLPYFERTANREPATEGVLHDRVDVLWRGNTSFDQRHRFSAHRGLKAVCDKSGDFTRNPDRILANGAIQALQ